MTTDSPRGRTLLHAHTRGKLLFFTSSSGGEGFVGEQTPRGVTAGGLGLCYEPSGCHIRGINPTGLMASISPDSTPARYLNPTRLSSSAAHHTIQEREDTLR